MEQRLGFVGIVVENRQSVPMVNEILFRGVSACPITKAVSL